MIVKGFIRHKLTGKEYSFYFTEFTTPAVAGNSPDKIIREALIRNLTRTYAKDDPKIWASEWELFHMEITKDRADGKSYL